MASLKKIQGITLGNVLGANTYNILGILGIVEIIERSSIVENTEKIDIIKNYFAKKKTPILQAEEGDIHRNEGNSFIIEFTNSALLIIF